MVDLTEKLFNESEEYINSLSHSSAKKVSVICPECQETRTLKYFDVTKVGHTFCKGCARKRHKCDAMIGKKFGRLTVKSYAPSRVFGGANHTNFNVVCDCGNELEILAGSIKSGRSKSCGCLKQETITGSNNLNFRHDLTEKEKEEMNFGRKNKEAKEWRRLVKKRDGHSCQICDSKEKLVVHHLENYADNKELRYQIDNGVTLCQSCHIDFHCNFMGNYKTPCTAEDFDEYLIQV